MGATVHNTLKISVKRSSRSLDGARKKLALLFNNSGVDIDIMSQVDLTLYEIISNIIEHTGKAYRKDDVRVTCIVDEGSITLMLQYSGGEFDISMAPMPEIEAHVASGKKRGLGIYIIRTLMDRIEYSHENKMNCLTLTKITRSPL